MAKTTTIERLPIRQRIEAANTELQNAKALQARLRQYTDTNGVIVDVDEQFRNRIRAGADPADLVDEYIDARNRQTALGLFGSNVVRSLLERVTLPVNLEKAFADDALDMCRDELDRIMAAVTEHRNLIEQHPATIDAALAAGSLDDWQTVEDLLNDYDQLRAEYRRQIRLQDSGLSGPKIGAVECKHFVDIDLYFVNMRRRTSILEGYQDQEILRWFRPEWNSTNSRSEHLLRIADNQPWLPDADELGKLNHIVEQLCNHQWHTGNLGSDRQFFDNQQAQLKHIVFDEPLPEPSQSRRLA